MHENVISNVMKGMSPLELAGMSESTVANGVVIWRPLLQHLKAEIYDFAHEWGIPYLKDSTPLWSTRGKIRNRLMPLLAEIYGEGYLNNLSRVAQASEDALTLIRSNVYSPFLKSVYRFRCGIRVNVVPFIEQPTSFWKEMLKELMHSMGMSMARDAGVKNFVDRIRRVHARNFHKKSKHGSYEKRGGWLELRRGVNVYIRNNGDLVIFLGGLLAESSYPQLSNQGTCRIISDPFDFEHILNININANVCYALEDLRVEFFIRGWRILVAINQTTRSSNSDIEGENFIVHLLQGNFEYRIDYPSGKKVMIALIQRDRTMNLLSDRCSHDSIGDREKFEDTILTDGIGEDKLFFVKCPSTLNNVNAEFKYRLPLLNIIQLSDSPDGMNSSGENDNICEKAGTVVFNFCFVGDNKNISD